MYFKFIAAAQAVTRALVILVFASAIGFASAAAAVAFEIVAIGDSNVAGHGVGPLENYPAKLEQALRARGYDVQVRNEGIDGDTVQGVLGRIDSGVPQGTRLAIVWVGINDLRDGVPAGTVEATRQQIAARMRARGTKVLLLGPRHGMGNQPQYLIGDRQNHLNGAGYDVMVARTLPQVMALIGPKR